MRVDKKYTYEAFSISHAFGIKSMKFEAQNVLEL